MTIFTFSGKILKTIAKIILLRKLNLFTQLHIPEIKCKTRSFWTQSFEKFASEMQSETLKNPKPPIKFPDSPIFPWHKSSTYNENRGAVPRGSAKGGIGGGTPPAVHRAVGKSQLK